MQLYTDLVDIKRCIVRTQSITPEFMIKFFGNLTTTGTHCSCISPELSLQAADSVALLPALMCVCVCVWPVQTRWSACTSC